MRQTASTTIYNRGTVVLVPFPFTDLSGLRNRPGLIVSANTYNQATNDLIIAQITGNISVSRTGDHLIANWREAGLRAPSVVRAKLATLARDRVQRSIGRIATTDMQAIEDRLRSVLNL